MKLTQNTCFGGSFHVVLIGDFAYTSTIYVLSDAKISRPFCGYPKTSIRSRKERGQRERKRKKERKKNILE